MPAHPALASETAVRAYVSTQLAAAVSEPRHGWHWPSLTTGGDSRVVVLRGVREGGSQVTWYTDRRSDKVAQLREDHRCVLLFYHGDHRTQLRLYGEAEEERDGATRRRLWAGVSSGAKSNYVTASAPGTPLPDGRAATDLPDAWPKLTPVQEARAFAHFAVYRTYVSRADFLQLLDEGAYRSQWSAGGFAFVTP